MSKILITGGNGFIGSHLITKLLKAKHKIYITSHSIFSHPNCDVYHINLLDIYRIGTMIQKIKPDYLIHLAWDINTKTFWQDEVNLSWTQATIELFRQFYKHGGKKAIFMGSYAEYSWKESGCMDEYTSPTTPNNLYGLTKLACSQMLTTEATTRNHSFVWCRLFSVFGMRNYRQTISTAIDTLISNKKFVCNYGDTCRDFIYVDDVVSALMILLDSNITGIVNIGNNNPIKISSILNHIADKLDKKDLLVVSQEGTTNSIYANNSRLLSTDWTSKYDMYSSLNEVINWYLTSYFSTSRC
jgi:nucleoside-diphosphate-sugar epimerase